MRQVIRDMTGSFEEFFVGNMRRKNSDITPFLFGFFCPLLQLFGNNRSVWQECYQALTKFVGKKI